MEGTNIGGGRFTLSEWLELPFSDLSMLNRFGQKMSGMGVKPEEITKMILDAFKTNVAAEARP